MLTESRRKSIIFLAAAFALPPKIIESSYQWIPQLKALPQIKARSVEYLSKTPVIHGGLAMKNGRLLVLSPEFSRLTEYSSKPLAAAVERPAETEQNLFWQSMPLGNFKVQGSKLHYYDVWSVPLGFEPMGVERYQSASALIGWGSYPAELFYFPSDLKYFYKIHWSEDSEPVRFFFCDRFTPVLVENLKNAFTRMVFFKGNKPSSYTVFDFSGELRRSDVSAVTSSSCADFYFAGTFGLVRVQYGRTP